MGKQCARRVFAVFMVLFLTVGILTFPSDAQEAAYTQLQQRENVTLKRLAGIPAEEAKIALSNAGFDTSDITDDMLSLFYKSFKTAILQIFHLTTVRAMNRKRRDIIQRFSCTEGKYSGFL